MMDWPVSQLLPHAGNMMLLDEVCAFDDEGLTARATVKPSPYSLPDGSLPPWLGLELMAQAVGAWAGCQARQAGKPVQLGFLLGTRRYDLAPRGAENFAPGTVLTVTAQRSLVDANGMAVFECALYENTRLLAQARLNIYQPLDARALLEQTQAHPE